MARTSNERTVALLREPELIDQICEHIAEGGTLVGFTSPREMRYGYTFDWLTLDPDRNARYQAALKARKSNHEDRVIEQIRGAAEVDIRRAYNEEGDPLPPHRLPDDVAMAVSEITRSEDAKGVVTHKFRLVDKTRNAELLGKTSALFKEVAEIKGDLTLRDLLKQAKSSQPEAA